jgi:hypothetical protein
VTTIFANFVGRSVVSAITHTPASGPFELVTTPPMSSESIATVAPFLCCASTQVSEAASRPATANKPALGFTLKVMSCSSRYGQRACGRAPAASESAPPKSEVRDVSRGYAGTLGA